MKVKILSLLLSSLTLLSPAGHASVAPGLSVGFSPEGSAEALVLGVIDRAQADIRLAGYSFTSPDVSAALVRAKARGVDVRVVLDEKANQNRKSQAAINVLTARDIPVRLNGRYAALHDKFIVADGRTVKTGSVNYTRAGARYNSENALVIEGMPELADRYLQHWQSRWDAGTDYRLPTAVLTAAAYRP
ncbi:phospholipase D family nuclease [Pantoea agglomerans]|uniref:phospholipase D family nuclease n=1 Tax=Enterobacter agglomerans TaxID=549 RepID=UPI000DAE375D|nr:phospholipase D family protein [Pantoea agglomerans]RAH27361.1 phospholipase D family protein [Pantoea agglomerans]TGX89346.1 phospholipase D family protein [Pantoea agglomerans]